MSYCSVIEHLQPPERKALHRNYHDHHYGFPIHDDNELFGRLVMEINQAGLSWETILKKEASFRKAYSKFNILKVAAYTQADRARLLQDVGIIRNKLKIDAAIENAKTLLRLQKEFGSFEKWLAYHHPKKKEEWVKLFKKTFRFTGGEIVNEFLMSIGYLPGAHADNCPVQKRVLKQKPMWSKQKEDRISPEIKMVIHDWLAASNAYDVTRYLKMYHKDAVLDDPSVGQVFKGHPGIRKYFEDYFIGYQTQTRLIKLVPLNEHAAHIDVEFTGEFPGGKIKGVFDFVFKDGKIASAKAGLL